MKKLLLLFILLALPLSADCPITDFVIEPEQPLYGEDIDVLLRGSCESGLRPPGARIRVDGSTIAIELRPQLGLTLAPSFWGERVFLGRILPGTYEVVVRDVNREWGRRTLVVRDRPFSIAPNFGNEGTEAVLRGVHPTGCSAPPCFTVRFGGVPATDAHTVEGGDIVVTAPAHTAGLVDVTVTTGSETLTLTEAFRYGSPAESDYERVLLPMTVLAPGAHGSDWASDIVVQNNAPVTVDTEPRFYVDPDSPVQPLPTAIPPGRKAYFPYRFTDGGAFFYFPRGAGPYLGYASHILDRSRNTTDLGSEIPVVRARDTASKIFLPNIPVSDLFRARLRIYDFDVTVSRLVLVTLRTDDGKAFAFGLRLNASPIVCPTTPCLQPAPPFRALDLAPSAGAETVDITVESFEKDARLWAFASVTNNETQHVTMHTPLHDRPQQ
ncbi:MAG TPA: hypothetical protein VEK57_03920 [Thermoanaerobaculia bacterium]|nr:hypothetical protein [Thermoanaerobaculia bacterium]